MRNLLISATLALAALSPVLAHATTYNPVTDFSTGSNPSGAWSYYGYNTATGYYAYTYSDTAFNGTAGYNYWSDAQNDYNLIGLNTSGVSQGTYFPSSSELWMHPGPQAGGAAVLFFTAPTAGTYNYSGLFERVDTANGSGDGVQVFVADLTSILDSGTLGTTYLNSHSFNGNIFLNSHDLLAFIVQNNGTYYNDSTGLQLSISDVASTPEPSSIALLGTGVLGMAGMIRRRFKA